MSKNIEHPHAIEMQKISGILDGKPIIIEWVLQDLVGKKTPIPEHKESPRSRFCGLL